METITLAGRPYQYIMPEVLLDTSGEITAQYDMDYYYRFMDMGGTAIGIKLNDWRYEFVQTRVIPNLENPKVLDYGCGCGELILRDAQGSWYGYDILPYTEARLEWIRRGSFDPEPDFNNYDVICMFDVLEHLTDPTSFLKSIPLHRYLAITIPCWEYWGDWAKLLKWKHFRPGEHFLYVSRYGFQRYMRSCGFDCVRVTYHEIVIGRQDVVTFIFLKITPDMVQ